MDGKFLGKITSAEFGMFKDTPLMGLQLKFRLDGCMVSDGGRYCVNTSPKFNWSSPYPYGRAAAITRMVDNVESILKEAKVYSVSELVGKPVQVTIDQNIFVEFRILTEVL